MSRISTAFVFKEEAQAKCQTGAERARALAFNRVSRPVAKEECQFAESPLRGGERPRVPCVGMEILKRAGWNSGRDVPPSRKTIDASDMFDEPPVAVR